MTAMKESSRGHGFPNHGFGNANFHRQLRRLKLIKGKIITTGSQPIEWFYSGPCGHEDSCATKYQCIRLSDKRPPRSRIYYNQIWLRSLTCKSCFSPVPALVSAYNKISPPGVKPDKSLSSGILCICCPTCHAVLYAYHSLFPISTKLPRKKKGTPNEK